MSDTVITMMDGSTWKPSSSEDVIQCANCDNIVDTEEEAKSYASSGKCPNCGNSWTERRSTTISITAPSRISGGTM